MSDSKLGFTFYPKDWWTSDTFYALNPFERYIYLEILFMMYANDGCVADNKVNVERRLGTTIKDDVWVKITDLMVKDGDQLTHRSVNKRLRKTITNRENGKLGGRPKKEKTVDKEEISEEEKPKKPKIKTQNNPPSEREYKEKENINKKEENIINPSTHQPDDLVLFQKFNDWLKQEAPRVLELKNKISIDQFLKLKKAYPDMKRPAKTLKAMHNYKPLTKNYVDAYLTLKKWMDKDEQTSN